MSPDRQSVALDPALGLELLELSPFALLLLSAQGVVYVNRRFWQLTGLPEQAANDLKLEQVFCAEDWPNLESLLQGWEEQGPLKSEYACGLRNSRGGRIEVALELKDFTHQGSRHLALFLRNITKFKLAEAQKAEYYRQLQINLEYFDNLFELMPVGAWVIDILPLAEADHQEEAICSLTHRKLGFATSIQRVNRALEACLGFHRSELKGISIFDPKLVDNHQVEVFVAEMLARREGKRGQYEITLLHKSGRHVPVQVHSIPTLYDPATGEAMQSIGLMVDLSERKKWEAELFRLNQELLSLSETDALTSLANRRRFDEFLAQEISQAAKDASPLSLIMLDIDYFKPFNDHYGHQAGDEALRQVAGLIKTTFRRKRDLVARYGGEEFAIVLPHTPQAEALRLAEDLRHRMLHLAVPHEYSLVEQVITLSMGVASINLSQVPTPETLIHLADDALYQAKEGGRNRVVGS